MKTNFRFIYVNVGAQGRISDGGVFAHTSLHTAIEDKSAGLPEDDQLPFTNETLPYSLVADEAFPLRAYIMKPFAQRNLTYPQRAYNYRLSRARRTIENAFGILANRFKKMLFNLLQISITACFKNKLFQK